MAAAVRSAVRALDNGQLVVFPTETSYGLGADATNPQAVNQLLKYKSRRQGKPLSIAVSDQAMAERYVELNDQARQIYQRWLPGPVTVVSPGRGAVASGVESEFGTLGVRIPDYPLVLEIVRRLGRPITATSANASGQARPYAILKLLARLTPARQRLLDLVLDAGQLPVNPPSTVIDTTLSAPVTLRAGKVAVSDAADWRLETFSPAETRQVAGRVVLRHWDRVVQAGLVIGLEGELGAGKTVFAQGVAEFLGIDEQLSSPTFIYAAEYAFRRHQASGQLYHLDMWKVDTRRIFDRLEVGRLAGPGRVLAVEWWNQVKAWWPASQAARVVVRIEPGQDQRRHLNITNSAVDRAVNHTSDTARQP